MREEVGKECLGNVVGCCSFGDRDENSSLCKSMVHYGQNRVILVVVIAFGAW